MSFFKSVLAFAAITAIAGGAYAAAPVVVYENNFNSYDDFSQCTLLDKNNDGVCWDWRSNNGQTYAYCLGTESYITANDWLITPPVALQKDRSYRFTVVTCNLGEKEEKFEGKWGTGYHVEQLTMPAIQPVVMDSVFTEPQTVPSQRIDVTSDGEYRFAYHMMSAPYSTGVAVLSMKVEDMGLTADLDSEPVLVFSEQFESPASFIPFKTYDMNGDGAVWSHNNTKYCAQYTYSSRNKADDHLVTPAIPLQVGRNYKIKFKVSTASEPERLEVLLGTTDKPADMLTTLIEPAVVAKRTETELGNELFKVSASGNYHISFHAISDADADKLYIDDIEVWDIGPNGETGGPVDPGVNARPIPYSADMTLPATFAEYSVFDANYDGRTWKYDPIFETTLYGYSPERDADDWLFTPALKLETGKTYRLTVTAASRGLEFPEKFEARLGKGTEPAAYTETVIEPVTIVMNPGDPALRFQSSPITVTEEGAWNIGIHAISAANMSDLIVNHVLVEEVFPDSPRAVTDLKATADPAGQLKATISFTAPTHDYSGKAITAPLTKIEIRRGDKLIRTVPNVGPGKPVTVEDDDSDIQEGMNQYSVLPYVGEHAGDVAEVNLYIGCDVPVKVTGAKGEDLGDSVLLEWNAVSNVGKNGGLVYPDLVSYNIYEAVPIESFGIIVDIELHKITSVKGTSAEIAAPDMNKGSHKPVHYAVAASTGAGEGPVSYINFLQGLPYTLPYQESFAGGDLYSYMSVDTDCADQRSGLYVSSNAADDDGGAIAFVSYEGDKYVAVFTGKMATKGAAKPVVSFQAKNAIGRNELKIVVITPDNVHHDVAAMVPGEDYEEYEVDLTPFKDELWTRVIFAVEFPFYVDSDDGNELDLDTIRIFDSNPIGIVAPAAEERPVFPCDIYSVDGRLLRRNATSFEGLSGIVIANGHRYIVK